MGLERIGTRFTTPKGSRGEWRPYLHRCSQVRLRCWAGLEWRRGRTRRHMPFAPFTCDERMPNLPEIRALPDDAPGYWIDRLDGDEDLDGVLFVESESFTNPWTRDMYAWELQN